MSANPNSSARIFLSYRRDDVPDAVDRIADRLRERFGKTAIFVDIESIGAGEKWREALTRALDECEAVLIIIGPHWLRKASDAESLALDDPDDLVRNEIATALSRDISVIPILWGDAEFPPSDALPSEVCGMTEYQAFSIRREHFESDVRLLLGRVEAQVRMFASFGRRIGAFFIDLLPALAITIAIGWSFLPTFWVLLVAYHWLLVGTTGRTLGKLVMGTRVESSQPTLVRWLFALARPLLGYPILLLSGLGAIQLVLHPQHVAIHDRLFRANVVQVRRRPVAAGLRGIDRVSYSFDEWLFKLLVRMGLGFVIVWANSFFGTDRPVQWMQDKLNGFLNPQSHETDARTVSDPTSVASPTTTTAPPIANVSAGGTTSGGMLGGAGIAGTGTLLAVLPPLIVGLVLATVSVTIYEGVTPAPFGLFTSQDALSIKQIMDQIGVTEEQAQLVITLAVNANANGELVLAEAIEWANYVKGASVTDSLWAVNVTGISFTAVGGNTAATINPANTGVTVTYSVSGTDGYFDSGSLQTDSSGKVFFYIPAGESGVTDKITVTAVLSGINAATSFTW